MCACEWRAGDRQATTAAEGADEGQPSPIISFPKAPSQVEPQALGAPPPWSSQAFRCNAAALNSRLPGAPPATSYIYLGRLHASFEINGSMSLNLVPPPPLADLAPLQARLLLCHLCPLILKTHYIWRGIQEIMDEEMDEYVIVKAVDCSNQSEVHMLMHATKVHYQCPKRVRVQSDVSERIANGTSVHVKYPIYDQTVYLNDYHKKMLKDQYGKY
ncbi:hypothetical protein ZEAMMB73_Zm00001d045943 [Zea mays]|uniref:Uncharacterized protein n=1 Tax=Zea mays TaxID=4577 RepID=A0A1D6NZY3_MAIZE|nr:hypothetical protein ZEAMMB73_Zm00001d045943 [Zea mays]